MTIHYQYKMAMVTAYIPHNYTLTAYINIYIEMINKMT